MANNDTAWLAVLIDADNASASVVKALLEEVAKYGTATVKRTQGGWSTSMLAPMPKRAGCPCPGAPALQPTSPV